MLIIIHSLSFASFIFSIIVIRVSRSLGFRYTHLLHTTIATPLHSLTLPSSSSSSSVSRPSSFSHHRKNFSSSSQPVHRSNGLCKWNGINYFYTPFPCLPLHTTIDNTPVDDADGQKIFVFCLFHNIVRDGCQWMDNSKLVASSNYNWQQAYRRHQRYFHFS